jgi:murein L,D-transpeptidase YcbB/YkuD
MLLRVAPKFLVQINRLFRLCVFIVLVTACHTARRSTVFQAPNMAHEVQIDSIRIPSDPNDPIYTGLHLPKAVMDFYKKRQYKNYWHDVQTLSDRGKSMIAMIRSARRYGLLPQHYHMLEVNKVAQMPADSIGNGSRLDIILTDAFFSLSYDLRVGRINHERLKYDSAQILGLPDSPGADITAIVESYQPAYSNYHELKRALNVILDTLKPEHRNLLMSGMTSDTIQIHRKIQQIEINMDRWRSETADRTGSHVWINIPAFMFYVFESDSLMMNSRVIVGTPVNPTPVFSSKIECFTIFPYWYMPRKIAVNEYLPVIKKDTTFITRNNFDVLDRNGKTVKLSTIDWKKYNANNFPFVLRQREGKENALGVIKFVFDNPYAVYLHDTNAKRLFKNQVRAYSHGCIRLEKAVEFAHYLIGDKRSTLTGHHLDKYLQGQKRVTISLLKEVPIHIRYLTAEVRHGSLIFYNDLYKIDTKLINLIYRENFGSNSQVNRN